MNDTPKNRRTPVTFSRDDSDSIREMLATPDAPLQCPRCEGQLQVGQPAAAGGTIEPAWEIRCAECHRVTYVGRIPKERHPS